MSEGPDRRAFEVVTAPYRGGSADFGDIAKAIAAADTLEGFLRDIRARFPETGTLPPGPMSTPAEPAPPTTGSTNPASRPAG